MPRAALLSIHARVEDTEPSAWEDPSLVQLWGPRHNVYTVAARDLAVFSIGIHPTDERRRHRAEDRAALLRKVLGEARMDHAEVGRALGVHPNSLMYASTTGTVLIRWDGAHRPTVWTVPAPATNPCDAQLELARRYLHIYGPATAAAFGWWSGLGTGPAAGVFEQLSQQLTTVRTPIGEAWIQDADEPGIRDAPGPAAPARLLPSGDAFILFHGPDRELLVPDAARRQSLWTPRVWPGGVLVEGELVGTWRRAGATLTVRPWMRLSAASREAVEREAAGLPLPGLQGAIRLQWDDSR